MFQAGTDPAVAQSDFDHDGLGIATERGDVIAAWACFHIPDIFVEVDWMPGHEMSDEAVAKVLWAFARHGIALYIDRGEMGGGGQVTHLDEIYYSVPADPDDTPGDMDDIYDYKDAYFSNAREGIFHWCLMAHLEVNDPLLSDILGRGDCPGDTFALYDDNLDGDATKQAKTFQHELGHNIIGYPGCPRALVDLVHYYEDGHSRDSNSLMRREMDFSLEFTAYDWSVVVLAISF